MRIFSYVLSFAYTATLVAALPAETISDSELQRRDELADALRSAKSQFPAIWWDVRESHSPFHNTLIYYPIGRS